MSKRIRLVELDRQPAKKKTGLEFSTCQLALVQSA